MNTATDLPEAEIQPPPSPLNDLDRLAQIAAALCSAPMAFVATFDETTQWLRAKVGIEVDSTARSDAICNTVFDAGDAVVICDLIVDPRTSCNPIVSDMGLRFYAGHPIRDQEGEIIGTICVMDHDPRPQGLTLAEIDGLCALSEQAATMIDMRRSEVKRDSVLLIHEMRERSDRSRIARLSALVHLGDRLRDATTRREMFSIAGETLGIALDCLQAGCAQVDLEANTATVEVDWSRDGVPSSAGVHHFEDHDDIFQEMNAGRAMSAIDTMINDPRPHCHLRVPIMSQGRLVSLVYAIDHANREWSSSDREFARIVADRVNDAIDRLCAQEEAEVMMGEVGHRMKNMMAVTRAIVTQTLAGRIETQVMKELDERLTAYSGAHDLLLSGGGDVADLRETAENTLNRLSVEDRVMLTGPDMLLNQRTSLAFSLLVNELATNAMKYGSLSRAGGRVMLDWRIEEEQLIIEWREHGGPPAIQPSRKGFGGRLINMGLGRPGGTSLDYGATGLSATFKARVRDVVPVDLHQ